MLGLEEDEGDGEADEVIQMTGRGSILSETQSVKSAKDSIASRVSEHAEKLIEMGFSKDAANVAAKESLERREEQRQKNGGGSSKYTHHQEEDIHS